LGLWRRTFSSLAFRDYRIYFIGQGISLVGTWMRMTAQGWLVYDLTDSKLLLGTVTALGLLPLLLFSTQAGALADRFPKRRLLLVAQAIMMTVSLSVATLVATDLVLVWHLLASALLFGVAFSVDLPTRQSFYIQLVGREALQNAIALNSAAFNGARIIGPALAGMIIAAWGVAACYFIDAASFVAVLVSLLLVRAGHAPAAEAPASHWQMLRQGFAYVWGTDRVRVVLLLFAATCVFGWSYVALIPAYARDILGLRAVGYGTLMATHGAGALAGALYVAGRAGRRDTMMQPFGGIYLFSAALLILAFARTPWLSAIALALSGAGLVGFVAMANTRIQLSVPDSLRGRVMGVWGLVFGGGLPLGSFLLGLLAQKFGVTAALALAAIACGLVSLFVLVRSLSRPNGAVSTLPP
jgi:MFS family permease